MPKGKWKFKKGKCQSCGIYLPKNYRGHYCGNCREVNSMDPKRRGKLRGV